jgi:hypothetical protein
MSIAAFPAKSSPVAADKLLGTDNADGTTKNFPLSSLLPPALLPNLGRGPRILLVGESILNSGYLAARLAAALPGAVVDRRTYGGSQSAMGLLLLATDVRAYAAGGNLVPDGRLTQWGQTGLTVAAVASPTTGRGTYRLTAAGAGGQRLQHDPIVVPTGAPQLTYSIEVEPGTLTSFRLMVYNKTTSNTIKQVDFAATNVTDRANLPTRYSVTVKSTDGVGYAAGDEVRVYLYPGAPDGNPAGTLYARNPTVTADGIGAGHVPTAGTAQAASAAAWRAVSGTDRALYDLVVIQFGRNDAANLGGADHEALVGGMIAGAAQLGGRVLVMTCPPQANGGLTAWEDAATDPFQASGLSAGARRAALRAGAGFYDAVADFQASGLAVSALMRDIYHPTDADATSAGIGRYVTAIAAFAASAVDRPARVLARQPQARLGGQVASGTWAWTAFAVGTSPTYNATGPLAGQYLSGEAWALVSSTATHSLTYSVTGRVVGVVVIADAASPGVVSVSVDGGPGVSVSQTQAGVSFYPKGFVTHADLPDGEHTVTVTVVSGQARVVGVVAC